VSDRDAILGGVAVPQSPLTATPPVEPGDTTQRELWGYVFWGAIALFVAVMELLAHLGDHVPFPTISQTAANLAARHHWVSLLYVGGLVTLTARIVFYPWPNRTPER
jgi:hypothetical protein